MNVEKRFRLAAYLALIAFFIARGPLLMTDGKVFDLPLSINAGHVVIFGPIVILLFYGDTYRALRSGGHKVEDRALDWVFRAIVFAPALLSGLLVLQYFEMFRKLEENCDAFPTELFWSWEEFRPVYCMDTNADFQDTLPWMPKPPPLLTLIEIGALIMSAVLAWWTVRLAQAKVEVAASVHEDD